MLVCPTCGRNNRVGARFCWNCATPLGPAEPTLATSRPTPDDARWLEATLIADPASEQENVRASTAGSTPVIPVPPIDAVKEKRMDEAPTQPQAPALFAGRYELMPTGNNETSPATVPVEVIDHQPWLRCWACGSTDNEPNEHFCTNCGADLTNKHYRAELSAAASSAGLALLAQVQDADARAILPEIWDQVSDHEQVLTVVRDSGRASVAPPLDELAALQVGVRLARLLTTLHTAGLALGPLTPADIELDATGAPRLRDAPSLQRMAEGADGSAVAADLRALASLLEALTDTPRTTQRLDEEAAESAIKDQSGTASLASVLRELRTGAIGDAASLADTLQHLYDDRARPVPLRAHVGAASNTGVVRDHNEDSMFFVDLAMNNLSVERTWGVYIVADGMGGHAAGEIASGLAIRGAAEVVLSEYVTASLALDSTYDEAVAKEIVRRAVLQANDYVLHEAQSRGNDMGTTITMALVMGDRAVIGNVGDSRTYMYRDGELRRISNDHSLVMRLVEIGQITEDEIYTHPQRNAVLRSLGDKPNIEVDLFVERLRPGDALFLCSDGQWEMTHNPDMAAILANNPDPQQACNALIAAANQAGGEDNITALLVAFEALA